MVGANRVIGRHVDRRHEPARLIRADRQKGETRRAEAGADLGEMGAEGSVSREIDDAAGGFDHISAPECAIAIEESTRGKMHGGHAVDGCRCEREGIAPIEFVDGSDVPGAQQTGYAERNDESGLRALGEQPESGEIEMIVMIMAQEHEIDPGKIVETHARGAAAARTDPGDRTGPVRPDGVGQDVEAALLEQDCGVVDERDAEGVGCDGSGRIGWSDIGNEREAGFTAAGEFPAQGIEIAASLRGIGIEEALAVEVRDRELQGATRSVG